VNQICSGPHSTFPYPLVGIVNENNKYGTRTRIPNFREFPSKSLFLVAVFFSWLHFLYTMNEKVKTGRGSVLLMTSQCHYRPDWISFWVWCIYWKIHWRKQGTVRNSVSLRKWTNKYLIFTKYFLSTCSVSIKWIRNIKMLKLQCKGLQVQNKYSSFRCTWHNHHKQQQTNKQTTLIHHTERIHTEK
jgi:hypothetical protein